MTRHCDRRSCVRTITGAAGLLSLLAAIMLLISVQPAEASRHSRFCNPTRTLKSFGATIGREGFVAHLATAPGAVSPGRFASFRIVNEGTDELGYGSERTRRWVRGSWITMPEVGPSLLEVSFVRPRSVSRCVGPLTGAHWPPGRYRWDLNVEALDKSGKRSGISHHVVRALFEIRDN
jgi:hypothetical protein